MNNNVIDDNGTFAVVIGVAINILPRLCFLLEDLIMVVVTIMIYS